MKNIYNCDFGFRNPLVVTTRAQSISSHDSFAHLQNSLESAVLVRPIILIRIPETDFLNKPITPHMQKITRKKTYARLKARLNVGGTH
jgi:hypothetical protein